MTRAFLHHDLQIMNSETRSSEITIEVKGGDALPDDCNSYRWKDALHQPVTTVATDDIRVGPTIDKAFLDEEHHRSFGRPWVLGKYQFDFIRSRGLQKNDRLLDFGCGCGRFAIWAIRHLALDRYFGIDAHRKSLEALAGYEIPLHSLGTKRPRLLLNRNLDFPYFSVKFDWVMDFYSSFHITSPDTQVAFFERIAEVLERGGRYLSAPKPHLSDEHLSSLGLRLTHHEIQNCPLLEGHDYLSTNEWFEYTKSPE